MKFEYEEMKCVGGDEVTIYEMQGNRYYGFLPALNSVGQKGWELVTVVNGRYVFKREISA